MSQRQPCRVLFVDLENVRCSPAGEGVLRQLANQLGVADLVECDSAVMGAEHDTATPAPMLLEAARRRRISIKPAVRQIGSADLRQFDMVMALDLEAYTHLHDLQAEWGRGGGAELRNFQDLCRQHRLGKLPDPEDDAQGGFERVLDWLEAGCSALLDEIRGHGTVWVEIAERIGIKPVTIEPKGGGCINEAAVLSPLGPAEKVFAKCNTAAKLPMFAAEVEALEAIAETYTVRVPKPIAHGVIGQHSYLVLEYIRMRPGKPRDFHHLGEQLAELHQNFAIEFGWTRDNFIGETPQPNPQTADWASFFTENRIAVQLDLAQSARGRIFAHGEKLLRRIPELLGDRYEPEPSLLHGDLWSGNVGFALDGTPVIYDPASYYGDRETDLAFSEMFGGFPPDFYGGYRATYPLDSGYQRRRDLYQLYHVLNHFRLFGGGYGDQAEAIIRRLLVGF